jgi:hypothetical protein
MAERLPTHLRIFKKLLAIGAVTIVAGLIVLACYAYVIRSHAESLLKDITLLKVGMSTDTEVQQLVQRHRSYLSSETRTENSSSFEFKIQNKWLSTLKLEPQAWFSSAVSTRDGKVMYIGAVLFRSMDIFPTFTGSAGIVDEYVEPRDKRFAGTAHYYFPTPVGKPYLRVELDSHASPIERDRAFEFSFRCLTKVGGGCDLSCDYLPSAWQDWKQSLRSNDPNLEDFYKHYPKSGRCDSAR